MSDLYKYIYAMLINLNSRTITKHIHFHFKLVRFSPKRKFNSFLYINLYHCVLYLDSNSLQQQQLETFQQHRIASNRANMCLQTLPAVTDPIVRQCLLRKPCLF